MALARLSRGGGELRDYHLRVDSGRANEMGLGLRRLRRTGTRRFAAVGRNGFLGGISQSCRGAVVKAMSDAIRLDDKR